MGERAAVAFFPVASLVLMALLSSSTESHEEDNGGWSSFVSMAGPRQYVPLQEGARAQIRCQCTHLWSGNEPAKATSSTFSASPSMWSQPHLLASALAVQTRPWRRPEGTGLAVCRPALPHQHGG